MSVMKHSLFGIIVVSGIAALTAYHTVNKIQDTMNKNVVEWNSHLPTGFNIRLNNNVDFSGAKGNYILSQQKDNKLIDIFTVNFNSNFNILTLVLPHSKLPITGTGSLSIENLNNEKLKYSFDNKNKEFLTFNGYIEKNGNFNLKYNQSSYIIGIINENDDNNQVYFNVDSNTGKISKTKNEMEFTSLTPTLQMLDTPESTEGILIKGFNTNIKIFKNNNINNTNISSKIDSIEDMTPSNDKNNIKEGLFKIEGIDTILEINDNDKIFKHRVKVNIKSANTQEQKNVQVNLDYDMTVPQEAKSAILALLSSSQNIDLSSRQESAFKLFKTGFQFHLSNFDFNQGKEMGSMKFNINLEPQKKDHLLSDRVSFNGKLSSNGYASMILKQVIPFKIDDDVENTEPNSPTYEKNFSFNFDYNQTQLKINSKRVDKKIEEALIKSLVGLDMLMKEAEESFKKEKLDTQNNDSANVDDELLQEIPGTEDKPNIS